MIDTDPPETNGRRTVELSPAPARRVGAGGGVGAAPPTVGVLQAARRYPWLVILPMVLLTAAGLALALQRAPTYTAQSRLSVGRINLNAPGALSGFALATQSLAAQYSRTANAIDVVEPVAAEIGQEPLAVSRRISASPIPESPVFTIRATGPTEESAIRLVNETSDSLVRYVRELNDEDPGSGGVLAEFKRVSETVSDRLGDVERAREAYRDDPTAGNRRRLAEARSSYAFWKLQQEGLSARYQSTAQGATSSSLLQVLNPAQEATSDRRRWVQILGFAGLLAGLALGLGLATLWATRVVRRRQA